MLEKSKCHKLELHYQNAMFWLFPDQTVSLTFEQVPSWFHKEQHFPMENLLVKNILTGCAKDGNGGWVQEKELLWISARVVLLSPTPSISGSVGLKWSWEWDMNSHTARNTLLQSYRIPLICSALHSAVGLTLAVTQRSSGIIPPLWEKKSWWSPALLGLGAADLARQGVPAHFMPYRRNI